MGEAAMTYIHHFPSPLGGMTMASDGEVLTGLWFDDQTYFGSTIEGEGVEKDLPVFEAAVRWLTLYFSWRDPGFKVPVRLEGTPFRRAVWEVLREIPYGQTCTYGEIASELAKRLGRERVPARAIGQAVGHNPISLIIPCHRVVGAGGALTGYAGGLERKRALLRLERDRMDGSVL